MELNPGLDRFFQILARIALLVPLTGITSLVAQEVPIDRHVVESSFEVTGSKKKLPDSDSIGPIYDHSVETTLDLSWSFQLSDHYAFTAALSHESISFRPAGESLWEDDSTGELSELFISYSPGFWPGHELVLGRQSISDNSEWWDTTVDAVTLRGDLDRSSYVLSAGTSGTDITSEDDLRDPADDNVYWLFASATLSLSDNTELSGFLLRELDRSALPGIGDIVDGATVDEEDRNLLWHGFSLENESISTPVGLVNGSVSGSFVHGTERNLVLDDVALDSGLDSDLQTVVSIDRVSVRGWAVDTSVTLEVPLSDRPELTIGYAMGSGTGSWQPETSGSYRQSGTRSSSQLYDPELTNIAIGSVGISLSVSDSAVVDLTHYRFRKRHAGDSIGDTGIDIDLPDTTSHDLGYETELALYLQFFDRLDIDLIWSVFNPGRAYGDEAETSSQLNLELYYEF